MFRVLRNKNGTRRLVINCPHLSLEATIDGEGGVHVSSYEIRNDSTPCRGLGDTVAKMTSKAGIKPCSGCKKRQAKLNKLIPYKSNNTA